MIRVGIGGWTFAPWRGVFYPKGLPQARELAHASRHLTSIEINGTFYGSQKPESFRRWADETPDDFVFSVKGTRYATHRRELSGAGESVERFFGSGVLELKGKLGPVVWQLPPTKAFAEDDLGAFLALLPRRLDGRDIRHAVEVRHESFVVPEFIELLRKHSVAVVAVESAKHPLIADVTADFVYARLQGTSDDIETGYAPQALSTWANRVQSWEAGSIPSDLPIITPSVPAKDKPAKDKKAKRDVFVYMISGAKVRAPAAAMALIEQLS